MKLFFSKVVAWRAPSHVHTDEYVEAYLDACPPAPSLLRAWRAHFIIRSRTLKLDVVVNEGQTHDGAKNDMTSMNFKI